MKLHRITIPAAFVVLACGSQPSASNSDAEQQAPASDQQAADPFEIGPGPQLEPLSAAVIGAPIPTDPPALDFWKQGDAACEAGGHLQGAAPPKGREVACVDAKGNSAGMEAQFHHNGKLAVIGHKRGSDRVGVWFYFYGSGVKEFERSYVDGLYHGVRRRFAENGQEIEYGEYRGGRPWGLFVYHDEQGKELARTQLDKGTGLLVEVHTDIDRRLETEYVGGQEHGIHRIFDGEGHKLAEMTWSAGELHGPVTKWDVDGHKTSEGQWKVHKEHGEWTYYAKGQIVERALWFEGQEIARQLHRDGEPLAALPARTACDTNAGLSEYLASARGRGLPNEDPCVTRVGLFPGVIVISDRNEYRKCVGAQYVVDCQLVDSLPSDAELLARAGWAKASEEQRIEIGKAYVVLELGNTSRVRSEPAEPLWYALDEGGLEGVVWIDPLTGFGDEELTRFTFAVDGTITREVVKK